MRGSVRAELKRRHRLASDPDVKVRVQWGRIVVGLCLVAWGTLGAHILWLIIDRM